MKYPASNSALNHHVVLLTVVSAVSGDLEVEAHEYTWNHSTIIQLWRVTKPLTAGRSNVRVFPTRTLVAEIPAFREDGDYATLEDCVTICQMHSAQNIRTLYRTLVGNGGTEQY